MDLETAADELYGVDPDEFVPTRTRLVQQARAAKDRPLATAIAALKKPTRSAWLVNLLRDDRAAGESLTALAGRLAKAHQSVDLVALRAVGAERQKLVDDLTRRAVAAGAERGYVATEAVRLEVQGTLSAAVADASVLTEVLSARVVKAQVYSGFGFTMPLAAPAPATAPPAAGAPSSDDADAEAQKAGLAQQALAEATDRLLEARTALDRVQATADEATAVLDRASQEVADLRAELRRAEQAEDKARQAATQAADDVHDARTAVQQAERALAEAARAVG
ncbi:MAG: hypothetical protein KDB51_16975 [Propionibacteriaceae bacterium]|nr:hypothetical protein [Propionibacteriaceae bacterium]